MKKTEIIRLLSKLDAAGIGYIVRIEIFAQMDWDEGKFQEKFSTVKKHRVNHPRKFSTYVP